MLKTLVRLIVFGLIGALASSAVGAIEAKRRIVPSADPDAEEIALAAVFGSLEYRSSAPSFRGGSIECWYGGGVVDLRGATLAPTGARLTVRAVFGGCQVLLPPTWPVESLVRGLGGVNDCRPARPEVGEEPRLTFQGFVAFGGFTISSEEPQT
jgi:hypothetical protein